MTSRRKSREDAVKLLYQCDITEQDPEEFLQACHSGAGAELGVDAFCLELVEGTLREKEAIDAEIRCSATHWSLERISTVDRNVLRLAIYELLFRPDIPPRVTMNEAIEIAKKFSSAEAAAFVNGILDKVHHSHPEKGDEVSPPCG